MPTSAARVFPELYPELLPCRHHRLHRSHRMLHHRGVWWCVSCGHFCSLGRTGRSAPKKLLDVCVGRDHRTRAGQLQLNRLARGLHPRRGAEWPDPLGTRVDPLDVLPINRLWNKTSLEGMVSPLENQVVHAADDVSTSSPEAMQDNGTWDGNDDELGLALPTGLDTDSD